MIRPDEAYRFAKGETVIAQEFSVTVSNEMERNLATL